MLDNFHLAAIVKHRSQTCLLQIPLHQALQGSLADSWEEQRARFLDDVEEIEFSPGYRPERHERFRLYPYQPPGWLASESSRTIESLYPIARSDEVADSIVGIVAMARTEGGEEVVLFQNFTRSKVIRPGGFLFLDGTTYKSVESRGLTLDDVLSAVYFPAQRKLLFFNFRTVNTFLPLASLYQEASEQEIRQVLRHPLFVAEDSDATAREASQWARKRFAMLKDSDVLNTYTVSDIQQCSRGHTVSVRVSNGRIVFPADKAEAKRLLQFLNEELYLGPITETLYQTNSKREARH